MSKFKVTTKTIMFEEHIVDADNHADAETKALENDTLSSKPSTDNFGWEGKTDTISCEEIKITQGQNGVMKVEYIE